MTVLVFLLFTTHLDTKWRFRSCCLTVPPIRDVSVMRAGGDTVRTAVHNVSIQRLSGEILARMIGLKCFQCDLVDLANFRRDLVDSGTLSLSVGSREIDRESWVLYIL